MSVRKAVLKRLKFIFVTSLWAFTFSSCPRVYAQYDDRDEDALLGLYGDENSITIATGSRQSLSQAPAVTSVITAEMITAMGATELDQVLETVPGLHIGRSNVGYNPIYVFRGVASNYNPQVLMLVNGIPITNLFHGDRNLIWGGMPVAAIARIEVIRGPGSAVYGADAFAGVINIITKKAEDIDASSLTVSYGSFDTVNAAWVSKGSFKDFKLAFVAEHTKTNGHKEIIDADRQTLMDQYYGTDASLAPGPPSLTRDNWDLRFDAASEHWRFRTGYQGRRDWGMGAGVAEALDPSNRYSSDRINVDLTWADQLNQDLWDVKAQVSFLDTTQEVANDLVIFPPGTEVEAGVYPDGIIGNPEVMERHYRLNLSAFYKGFRRHTIRIGSGYYYGDVYEVRERKNYGIDPATGEMIPPGSPLVDVTDTPYVFLREDVRENAYFFFQDVWNFADDWELTAGVRHDQYSDFGATTNPRVALVWSTTQRLTSKILFGRAFRAPSFAETRAIDNPVILGNPHLDPETLESFEIAFDLKLSESLSGSLNLFQYDWSDIINFVPDVGAPTATARNAGQKTARGLEAELDWTVTPSLRVIANMAFADATNSVTSAKAAEHPRKQFLIKAQWALSKNISVYTQLNHVSDRRRERLDDRAPVDDYTFVDLNARYSAPYYGLNFSLAVRNLFDADAREPSAWSDPVAAIPNDLPLPGRAVTGTVQYKF